MIAGQLLKQANRLKRSGRLDEAITLYHQVIEINPHFAWAYYNLGDALVKQGKLYEAVALYSKSLEFNPNSAWLFYSLGEAFALQGDLASTIEYLQKAIEINPNFYKFYNFLAFILADNNNLNGAIVNLYKSLEFNINCWESHYLLYKFLIKKGDFYGAKDHYTKTLEINPVITQKLLSYKNKSNFIRFLEKTDFKRYLLEEIKKLKIKKILLTNHYFNIYSGSELVTFYLAQIFSDIGLNVTIASFVTGEPMISMIASHNIELINVIDNPLQIKQRKFDLAWCHHFPVIDYCVNDLGVDANFMVYSSLSPYEPLEKMTYLETSDVMLFNSKENQCIQAYDVDEKHQQKICVFNNSLPEEWFLNLKQSVSYHKEKHLLPQNIAVISNHIPPEIKKLSDLLNDQGIKVKFIGLENKQELVTPTLIDTYDAVITIGHTVQKAMSRKTPVYCYDRFGGPGWITKDNLIDAEYFNFSGRCCNRKLNAEDIKDEILQGYKTAIESLNYLFHYSQFAYSMEVNVLTVLQKLKLSDTTFAEKLSYHSLESYQIRKISQLYTYTKFNAGSKTTIVYLNKNDDSKIFLRSNIIQILNVIKFYEYDQTLLWGFNVESPVKPQIIYEYEIPVFGWVLGKKSPVVAVEVISNNTFVQQVSINQLRPDVARTYSHVPDAEMSGFKTIVNIGELVAQGELLIQAVCSNKSCIPLSKIQFQVVAAEKQ